VGGMSNWISSNRFAPKTFHRVEIWKSQLRTIVESVHANNLVVGILKSADSGKETSSEQCTTELQFGDNQAFSGGATRVFTVTRETETVLSAWSSGV